MSRARRFTSMIPMKPRVVFAWLLALNVAATFAGGTGDNALLIVDPNNAESMYAANYYKNARDIPDANVLYMYPSASNYVAFTGANEDGFIGTLFNRGIRDHIDYVVVMPGSPHLLSAQGLVVDGCSSVNNFAIPSAYTMALISDDILPGGVPVTLRNEYYDDNTNPRSFDSNWRWLNGSRSTNNNAKRYFIGAMLGYTGERGNSIAEIIDLIDRSVAADASQPAGTFYFMNNAGDPARNVRAGFFAATVAAINGLGGSAEVINGVLPLGRNDCLGVMTGAAGPDIVGGNFTLLPGSFGDHLTSYAGAFQIGSQTKMSQWITKGASGSAGAIEEPCNYNGKFPHPNFHTLYFQGMTLGECFLRSQGFVPFQILLYGDPLTQPWANPPMVMVPNPPTDPVSGVVQFSASASTSIPGAGIAGLDLLVDGVLRDSIANGGTFTLDTTDLPDGPIDVRVAAYDDTRVTTQGRWLGTIQVNNRGRSAALTPTSGTNGDLSTPFAFQLSAAGGTVTELRLVHGSRVVAAAGGSPANLTVYGQNLGAGPVDVYAEALFGDGTLARSAKVRLDIAFTPGSPSGPAPAAFSFTRRVGPDRPFVIELPGAYDDDPASASYTLLTQPAQSTVYAGSGAFRVMVPQPGASGTDSFTFQAQTPSGTSNVATVTLVYSTCDPCDTNCDGVVDAFDIEPFIALLVGGGQPCEPCSGDVNGDGTIDAFDIEPFIACLLP